MVRPVDLDGLNPEPRLADQWLMKLMGTSSAGSVVGLNIEPGFVAAVEARGNGMSIERAALAPLAPGVVREGEVTDSDALAGVLREMFREHKLSKRVRIGVANQRIIVRSLDLPPLTNAKDVASAVRFQAQEQIPMPLEQAVLEHQLLGMVETPDGPRTRVVLVAARRAMIEGVLAAVRKSGLRPAGIDLSAFAMIRALYRSANTGATLYMSIGGVTNIAIATGTTCTFTRVITYGTESIAGELAERRGLTLEHAHGWLQHVGLLTPVHDIDGDPDIVSEARAVLTDGRRRLADEVRNSLDFFRMQSGAGQVERAVLTGPALGIPGLAAQLGEELSLRVEQGVVTESRPGALGGLEDRHLAIAAGLTISEAAAA